MLTTEDFEEMQTGGKIEQKVFRFRRPARVWKTGLALTDCTFYIPRTMYEETMKGVPHGEPYSTARIESRKRYQALFFHQEPGATLFQRYRCKLLVEDEDGRRG